MYSPFDVDPDELLSILILRVLGYSIDSTRSMLNIGTAKVVEGERWFTDVNYDKALMICDPSAITRVVARELVSCEEIDRNTLVKAAQLTIDDILRHYREDYVPKSGNSVSTFDKHYNEMAEVATIISDVQKFIASYDEGEQFTVTESPFIPGYFTFQPPPKKQVLLPSFSTSTVSVDYPAVEYFVQHLCQDFADIQLRDWRYLFINKIPKNIAERLRFLGNTAKFEFCSECQVCKDLKV